MRPPKPWPSPPSLPGGAGGAGGSGTTTSSTSPQDALTWAGGSGTTTSSTSPQDALTWAARLDPRLGGPGFSSRPRVVPVPRRRARRLDVEQLLFETDLPAAACALLAVGAALLHALP